MVEHIFAAEAEKIFGVVSEIVSVMMFIILCGCAVYLINDIKRVLYLGECEKKKHKKKKKAVENLEVKEISAVGRLEGYKILYKDRKLPMSKSIKYIIEQYYTIEKTKIHTYDVLEQRFGKSIASLSFKTHIDEIYRHACEIVANAADICGVADLDILKHDSEYQQSLSTGLNRMKDEIARDRDSILRICNAVNNLFINNKLDGIEASIESSEVDRIIENINQFN